jgi:AraC-like DNA-binding protein
MSVTEVAYAVGYASLPSFSKAFRRKFGDSPIAYLPKRNLKKVRLG